MSNPTEEVSISRAQLNQWAYELDKAFKTARLDDPVTVLKVINEIQAAAKRDE